MNVRCNKIVIGLFILSFAFPSGTDSAEASAIDIKFNDTPSSESDVLRSLKSLVKIQGTGGLYQDGLYLMTHYGDREDLFKMENRNAMENPMINQTWRFCSIFSSASKDSVIVGRNWDNQNVGSVIINLYKPSKGYSSISFSRAMDMGYPLNMDLEEIKMSPFGQKLLLAPFHATDGINEHGLTVATAGVRQTAVREKTGKELVFVTYFVRILLDRAKNVKEAVEIAEHYIPFDIDKNSLNTHLFIADATGASVILEYNQDEWKKIYPDKKWQALTNKPVYGVTENKLKEQCWRYKEISEALDKTNTGLDWPEGMKILQGVSQKGTTWSVVYIPSTKELYFSIYQKWNTIYHIGSDTWRH